MNTYGIALLYLLSTILFSNFPLFPQKGHFVLRDRPSYDSDYGRMPPVSRSPSKEFLLSNTHKNIKQHDQTGYLINQIGKSYSLHAQTLNTHEESEASKLEKALEKARQEEFEKQQRLKAEAAQKRQEEEIRQKLETEKKKAEVATRQKLGEQEKSFQEVQLQFLEATFDSTYNVIISNKDSSWSQALTTRKKALEDTQKAPYLEKKIYELPEGADIFFDDATIDLLSECEGTQITNTLHEEFFSISRYICCEKSISATNNNIIRQTIILSIQYGITALHNDHNIIQGSRIADICWTLKDDFLLDLSLTAASEKLVLRGLQGDLRKTLPIAVVTGCINRMKSLGNQLGMLIDDPKDFLEKKINTIGKIGFALSILLNDNYEPLVNDYDITWTISDIQDRIDLNRWSNEACKQAWCLLGSQVKKSWDNANQESVGKKLGESIVDSLAFSFLRGSLRILKNIKPITLKELFVAPIEHLATNEGACNLHLYSLKQLQQFQNKSIKATLLDTLKVPCGEKSCTQLINGILKKYPTLNEIPTTEELARKLFSLIQEELVPVNFSSKDIINNELSELEKAATISMVDKAKYEGFAGTFNPAEFLWSPIINTAGKLYLPAVPNSTPTPPWQPANSIAYSLSESEAITSADSKKILDELPSDPSRSKSKIFTVSPLDIWRNPFYQKAKQLAQIFDGKRYCLRNVSGLKNTPLTLNAFHLIYPQIVYKNQNTAKGLAGFHYDGNLSLLRNNAYELEDIKHLQGGSYSADIYMFGAFLQRKSFFPAHWTEDTLCKKIIEALENNSNLPTYEANDDCYVFGDISTLEGVSLKVVISSQGAIKTIFPLEK